MSKDIETLQIIRDAFLQGRDLEAVELLKTLNAPFEPRYHNKVLACNARGMIEGGATVQITSRTALPFTPRRFAISSRLAPYFFVHDLRVGVYSQMVNADGLDGEFFSAGWIADDNTEVYSHALAVKEGGDYVLTVQIDAKVISRTGVAIDMRKILPGMDFIATVTNEAPHPLPFRSILLGYTDESPPPVSQT